MTDTLDALCELDAVLAFLILGLGVVGGIILTHWRS